MIDASIVDTFEYELTEHLISEYGSKLNDAVLFEFEKFDPRNGGSVTAHVFASSSTGTKDELSSIDRLTAASNFRLDAFVFAGQRVCERVSVTTAGVLTTKTLRTSTLPPAPTTTTPAASTFELSEGVITLIGAGGGVFLVLLIMVCLTCKRQSKKTAAKKKNAAIRMEAEQARANAAHIVKRQRKEEEMEQLQKQQAELQKQRQWQWNQGQQQFTSMQPGARRYAGHSLSPPTTNISWLDSAHTSAARGFHGSAWDSNVEPTEESYL
jgi:hypothetical protein